MLAKIYTWTRDQATQNILDTYISQWYCVVNYLYFANAMKRRLFEQPRHQDDTRYKSALQEWDYLLPDGIALQTFYKFASGFDQKLHNLNWTDFLPYFLNSLLLERKKVKLFVYGSKEAYSDRIRKHFTDLGFDVEYVLDGYQELDWSEIHTNPNIINILLVGRWTPLQEMWTFDHIDQIQQKWLLVMNQWWTFDFLIWIERRAPKWVIKSRVLETPWRVLTNPKKNLWKLSAMFGIVRYFFANR